MRPGTKRGLLGVALLATLTAVWFAPSLKDEGAGLSGRAQNASTRADDTAQPVTIQAVTAAVRTETSSRVEVLSIHPRAQEVADADRNTRLFASTLSTQPSKKTPVARAVAMTIISAPPQAPPLPFHVLGRYDEAGQTVIFLRHNDQNLVVRVGDTLADKYKVESLNGATLTLRYLPLNQSQSLEIDGVQ